MIPVLRHANGLPPLLGTIKASPEHFVVKEELGFQPDRAGEHLLLRVRKRSANTQWVARSLARLVDISVKDVGFAGMKDRHGIAEQWFTLRIPGRFPDESLRYDGEEFEIIEVFRHKRKLKRGALERNAFRITVTDLEGNLDEMHARLVRIAAEGVPNYFGPQRFGRDGANLELADALLLKGKTLRRAERSFALSAARSLLFNLLLSERVEEGSWDRLLDGDVANLNGSRSIFAVPEVDETLSCRAQTMDVHPTGPLWGRGNLETAGRPREMELRICGGHPFADGLVGAGLVMTRRSLRLPVRDLAWRVDDGAVQLAFGLGPGGYATSVMREIFELREPVRR